MSKTKGRESKGKEIRPTFFVFCEGDSEKEYIKFLRSHYRLPIETPEKSMEGKIITKEHINNYQKEKKYTAHEKDKTFLMYDLDVKGVPEKLEKIKNVHLLLSNPCFELWYLLHYQEQTAELDSKECEKKLLKYLMSYYKGFSKIDIEKSKIIECNRGIARDRAKKLIQRKNPSTNVYDLVDELEMLKNNN